LQLDPRFRAALYAAFFVLFATGAAWLPADRWRDPAVGGIWSGLSPLLLMVHGGAAMLALMLLGALVPFHLRPAWRRDKNRAMGAAMAALTALLIVSAFGLYYIGSDALRGWTSDLHIVLGLAFPVLLTAHVVMGKQRCSHGRKPKAQPWEQGFASSSGRRTAFFSHQSEARTK